MRNRILVACVGVPVILVVLYVLPAPFTPALIAVLSAVGTYEALHAIGMNPPRIALYLSLIHISTFMFCATSAPSKVFMAVSLLHLWLGWFRPLGRGTQ